MNNPNMNVNNAGNMMDMMKSNLLTMLMFKSINNGEKSNNIYDMIYVFLITQIIEFLFKNLPFIVNKMKKYSEENLILKSNSVLENILSENKTMNLSSSITIQINISDHENICGQALLDFITNNNNTKHISFKKGNFILNQHDVIEIEEEILIKLKENKILGGDNDNKSDIEQVVEDLEGKKDYLKLPNNCIFTMKMFQTNRKFSNLFGPEISLVKKRVDFFIKNKKWYDKKGIPYTLGLLLSGQAGSGKTSSIKCLANETGRHIINLNANNDITKIQLENLFFNEMIMVLNVSTGQNEKYFIPLDKRIYVFEDIDCQGDLVMERNLKDTIDLPPHLVQTEKIDLSFLLNLLDGVLEMPGRILVMTSNYPEKLDHALIRPGRIDIIADFKKCSRNTMIEIIEFFYDIQLNEKDKKNISLLEENIISPAELGKLMFENICNYELCIEKLVLLNKEKCSATIQTTNIDSLKNTYAENEDNQYTLTKTNVKLYPYGFSEQEFQSFCKN